MTAFVAIVCGLFGLVVGSFLNVVIWRVPRRESIVVTRVALPGRATRRSHRTRTSRSSSWLALRAKCRHCDAHDLGALSGGGAAHRSALRRGRAALRGLVGAARVPGVHGRTHRAFADRSRALRAARTACCIRSGSSRSRCFSPAHSLEGELGAFGRALLGGAVAFAVFFVIHTVSPRGLGFGDVRLSFLLGCFLGYLSWWHLFFGLFAGFIYGSVIGVPPHRARQARRGSSASRSGRSWLPAR